LSVTGKPGGQAESDGAVGGHDFLEHTADIGIRAWGSSREEAFREAGWGLAEILGIAGPERGASGPRGRTVEVDLSDGDDGGLLVDFLNELLAVHETEGVAFAAIDVHGVGPGGLRATLEVIPADQQRETTGVKAATYHQLLVQERSDGEVEVRVYLDV
jgi:SHS2 domain-containing protein